MPAPPSSSGRRPLGVIPDNELNRTPAQPADGSAELAAKPGARGASSGKLPASQPKLRSAAAAAESRAQLRSPAAPGSHADRDPAAGSRSRRSGAQALSAPPKAQIASNPQPSAQPGAAGTPATRPSKRRKRQDSWDGEGASPTEENAGPAQQQPARTPAARNQGAMSSRGAGDPLGRAGGLLFESSSDDSEVGARAQRLREHNLRELARMQVDEGEEEDEQDLLYAEIFGQDRVAAEELEDAEDRAEFGLRAEELFRCEEPVPDRAVSASSLMFEEAFDPSGAVADWQPDARDYQEVRARNLELVDRVVAQQRRLMASESNVERLQIALREATALNSSFAEQLEIMERRQDELTRELAQKQAQQPPRSRSRNSSGSGDDETERLRARVRQLEEQLQAERADHVDELVLLREGAKRNVAEWSEQLGHLRSFMDQDTRRLQAQIRKGTLESWQRAQDLQREAGEAKAMLQEAVDHILELRPELPELLRGLAARPDLRALVEGYVRETLLLEPSLGAGFGAEGEQFAGAFGEEEEEEDAEFSHEPEDGEEEAVEMRGAGASLGHSPSSEGSSDEPGAAPRK